MGALLYEYLGVSGPVGYGKKLGFAIAWGSPAPLNSWRRNVSGIFNDIEATHGAGFWNGLTDECHAAYFSVHSGIDFVNLDQHISETGGTVWNSYEDGVASAGIVGLSNDAGADGGGTPGYGAIPMLFGGRKAQIASGSFRPNVATGPQSITGLGFQPDAVIFLGGDPDDNDNDSGLFTMGAADKDGNQWAMAGVGQFGSASYVIGGGNPGYNYRRSEFRQDACLLVLDTVAFGPSFYGVFRQRASITSMDVDGFTINVDESDSAASHGNVVHFIAIKALPPRIGNPPTGIAVGTAAQGDPGASGLSFGPTAVFLASYNLSAADSADPTISQKAFASMGGTDGVTTRSSMGGGGRDTSDVESYYGDGLLTLGDANGDTISAQADLDSLNSDGWSHTWSVDDGHPRLWGWIAWNIDDLGGDPVLRNAYYLAGAPQVAGDPPDVDASDEGTGVGIAVALDHPTLALDQVWTRLDDV